MNIFVSLLLVMLAGGALCSVAQLLIDLTRLTPAKILVLYVCLGVLFYGLGIYEPLFEIFGAGVSVPLLGFGANIARGVHDSIDSSGPLGILSGGLTASSVGITAALLCGFLASVFFKPKPKRM